MKKSPKESDNVWDEWQLRLTCYLVNSEAYEYPWEWDEKGELCEMLAYLSQEMRECLYNLMNKNLVQ